MPYVEGYGSWPFGEEWLWEAMATSYLPLLDVLDEAPELTLSLTPVLCDQLEAPGVGERFRRLPWRHAHIEHDRLVTTLSDKRFTDLPLLAKDEWPAR